MIVLFCSLAAADDAAPGSDALPLPELHPKRTRPATVEREGLADVYRLAVPAGKAQVGTRLALVEDPGGSAVGELTLHGQVGWRNFGAAIDLVGTAGISDRWSGAGLGNATLDARWLTGNRVVHGLGLRFTVPLEPGGDVAWWGTVPAATLPGWGLAVEYGGATDRWVWEVRAGVRSTVFEVYGINLGSLFDLGAGLGLVEPIGVGWSLIGEAEVLTGPSPLHVRALVRRDLGAGWSVDGGLALPVVAMFADPTLQVLAQARRSW